MDEEQAGSTRRTPMTRMRARNGRRGTDEEEERSKTEEVRKKRLRMSENGKGKTMRTRCAKRGVWKKGEGMKNKEERSALECLRDLPPRCCCSSHGQVNLRFGHAVVTPLRLLSLPATRGVAAEYLRP